MTVTSSGKLPINSSIAPINWAAKTSLSDVLL
jgi:hypothetical protein